jgi:hypothetical protein
VGSAPDEAFSLHAQRGVAEDSLREVDAPLGALSMHTHITQHKRTNYYTLEQGRKLGW